MITVEELRPLVVLLQSECVSSLESESPKGVLRLRFASGNAPTNNALELDNKTPFRKVTDMLLSPAIGLVRIKRPFTGESFVERGETVTKGVVVAALQVGDVLSAIEADRDGTIGRISVTDGELVGFGSPILEWQ